MATAIDLVLLFIAVAVSGAQTFDRVAFIVCAVLVTYAIHRLANVRALGSLDGLRVCNWARSRRLDWAEILVVRFSAGDPWVYLDLADGTTLPVMAIQAADSARGRASALELAAAVATYGEAK